MDTWKAMEALVEKGLVKSIGVSNFNSEQLQRLLNNCKIKPIHNQIECHPGLNQKPLIALCKKYDIVVTAYCPLGRPEPAKKTPAYLFDDKVKAIGDKYKKSTAQVVLRYLVGILNFKNNFKIKVLNSIIFIYRLKLVLYPYPSQLLRTA